jgi:2-polyprenyl-6-methoxyphenol hydroxylase-like FAD-dependent oxidoreductase
MNCGHEIRFTLLGVEFRFQIRWLRSPTLAIQQYEVAPAPFLPEIRRTLLRRLKSRVRAEHPAAKPVSHSCHLRPQSWHRRVTWNLRGL